MANYWSPIWLYCDVCWINFHCNLLFFSIFIWPTNNIPICFVTKGFKSANIALQLQRNIYSLELY